MLEEGKKEMEKNTEKVDSEGRRKERGKGWWKRSQKRKWRRGARFRKGLEKGERQRKVYRKPVTKGREAVVRKAAGKQ